MIVVTQNPCMFPFLVLLWSLDAWFWLVSIKLIMEKAKPESPIILSLQKFADPLVYIFNRFLTIVFRRALPQWCSCLLTIILLIALRQLLVSFIN